MSLRPLHDRIICSAPRRKKTEAKIGGIIIPTPPRRKPQQAKGDCRGCRQTEGRTGKRITPDVKAGEHDSVSGVLRTGHQDRW